MSTPAIPDIARLKPVYFAVFLDMVAFAVILPVLPFYAMDLGATGLWLGVLLTSYSAAKLLGAAVAGRLSDLFGRRLLLVICLFGSGVSFLLTGLAQSLVVLAISRAIAGLFAGTVAIAQAYVADVTPPQDRARFLGLLGASIGMGFIIGPAIGASLSHLGFVFATVLAAGLAFLNAFAALVTVRDSPSGRGALGERAHWQQVLAQPGLIVVLAAMFLTMFAFVAMETTLAFVARDSYDLDERGFGMILVYVGLIMIMVQGGLVGRLVDRFGERRVSALGALLLGTGLFMLPYAPNTAAGFVLLGVLAVGQGLVGPSLSALLSRRTASSLQGGVLGLGQSAGSAARAGAPVVAGWLYDQSTEWPFLLAGGAALLAGLAVARIRYRESAEAEA
jgi:DHA1 family tetracycline resistance protein-like MFS transporter